MATPVAPLPTFNAAGDRAGETAVPAAFGARPNNHVVFLAVQAQLANRRTGTHSTLTKGEVRGGGKKPWKQKHTGRARQGSTRNPHWPGGGVSFGPKPRKYTASINGSTRRLALRTVVADKARSGAVAILQALTLPGAKTSEVAGLLKKVAPAGSVLVVTAAPDAKVRRAFRNLERARVETAANVSTYDLLKAVHIVVVADALPALVARCGEGN